MSPTQVGQATGSIAGGALAPGIGVPLGALIGTLAGMVVEQRLDQAREGKERVELSQQLQRPEDAQGVSTAADAHTSGQPTRVWVDEQWEHGRLIAGHFETRTIQ